MSDKQAHFHKKNLGFWEIWNMSFGFLGIQFGWGLQMANMSAIYENLGAKADEIPGLWLAAPLTGLIVQPIIGYMSDRTWTPMGRRKPYFLTGAILASAMLLLMPNSSTLWMAAGLLWILDASINISMEPFRAFVADMLPEEQQAQGYTMQSMFIGLGAIVASALPWIFTNVVGMSTETDSGQIPANVRWSFYLGAFAFLVAVLYTITKTKEYPPADMEEFEAEKIADRSAGLIPRFNKAVIEIFDAILNMPKVMRQLALVQFLTWPGLFLMWFYFGVGITRQVFNYVDYGKEETEYFAYLTDSEKNKSYEISSEIINKYGSAIEFIAKMEQKVSVQFGSANAFYEEMKANTKRKSDGNDWGGLCFAFYSLVTFIFSFLFLPKMVHQWGKKQTHFICLIVGAAGLLSVGLIGNKFLLLISMTGVGIAWSSILSMPYAMLVPHLSDRKTGLYVGIFNFFIVLPEILATLGFGWIMSNLLNNNRISGVICGGVLLVAAAIATLRVHSDD